MSFADTLLLLSLGLVLLAILILSMVLICKLLRRVELCKEKTEEKDNDSQLQMETIINKG